VLSGSACIKAAHRTLIKLTPNFKFLKVHYYFSPSNFGGKNVTLTDDACYNIFNAIEVFVRQKLKRRKLKQQNFNFFSTPVNVFPISVANLKLSYNVLI